MILLTSWDLALAALFVVALAGLSWVTRLGLQRQLLIAAVRTAVQLSLIGLVLKAVFAQSSLFWISLIAAAMLLIAGREVMARQARRFTGRWSFGVGVSAMFVSSFTLTLFTLIVVLEHQPWYDPRYAIPLLGMLLGNTMNGIALSMDRLTQTAWQQRELIEGRLMLGQRDKQALADIRRDSIRVGMIPIINAMAAAGIVSLPGMMTGQILAGAAPMEAVKYQILIMFLISAGTGFATVLAVSLGARRLFDERQRLRLDRLQKPLGGRR